ncbi:MAG TPA: DUF763 domain-containing protein [bacterium]|nr:DUF763 domain-containing protein [bacterium]HPP29759.1 DUF763 domain-containing protein [bacterium]
MIRRGIATFTLDTGKCPRWLFERMVKLGMSMVDVIVEEYGPDEFIERVSDPVWFQSLGTVLAFDWNASGLTTILTAALKESIRGREKELGIFICGGKGKTSLKTPDEIQRWGEHTSLPEESVNNLVYNSKMAAKIDNSLVQDGYNIYHHTFFFSRNGVWTVVQQGMNTENSTARRYHWFSKNIKDIVCEPHSGISAQIKVPCLNMTAKESEENRKTSTEIATTSYIELIRDLQILRKHSSNLSKMVAVKAGEDETIFLELKNTEFKTHPVLNEEFLYNRYLEKILWTVYQKRPENYERLVSIAGVGPKTVRALSLVAEVIYGAPASYRDPARYSFAHGGKDGTPYPVDRNTYDRTILFFREVVRKMKISPVEKEKLLKKLY